MSSGQTAKPGPRDRRSGYGGLIMYEPRHRRPDDDDDTVAVLQGRPGWTVVEHWATYQPAPARWSARVRAVVVPGKTYRQWHVAIIDTTGVARHALLITTIAEATRVAERHVRARNGDAG